MKQVSAAYRAALEGQHTRLYLIEKTVNGTTYNLSEGDSDEDYSLSTFTGGHVKDIDDIEITSEPKINEINIILDASDQLFVSEYLNDPSVNQDVIVTEIVKDATNAIVGGEIAYQGLISGSEISEESSEVDVSVSSIWADFEKVSGIRTNLNSQQRHYPTDTAFEHATKAMKSAPWGKEGPRSSTVGSGGTGTGGGGGSRFPLPELP